jgi:hypothetical protein
VEDPFASLKADLGATLRLKSMAASGFTNMASAKLPGDLKMSKSGRPSLFAFKEMGVLNFFQRPLLDSKQPVARCNFQ